MDDPASLDIGTRGRLLKVAYELVVERGLAAASMAAIAKAAGVSRQAVYLHFGSRTGLLVAMARHRDAGSDRLARVRTALAETAPAELIDAYFGAWLDYVAETLPIARLLAVAAESDADAALAWNSRMEQLRTGIATAMRRLRDAGLLGSDWTLQAAVDWAWSQSHPDVWRHLVIERGWEAKDAKTRIVSALRATLTGQHGTARRRAQHDDGIE
jgi:AcrR family transcriptional regulator